ncbi:MAG: BCCT family transporter [Pseudomonadota bacterium]
MASAVADGRPRRRRKPIAFRDSVSLPAPLALVAAFRRHVRPLVFWPPALILLVAVAASLIDFEGFLAAATAVHVSILGSVGWAFTLGGFVAVLTVIAAAVSPLGGVRIGGAKARPILSRWNWFSITLCTTIATGILFWGVAEPIMHFNAPPSFSDAEARSVAASQFSLSTLYLHWSFTPYAMYAVPALAFALAYYNFGRSYSLSAPLRFAIGDAATGRGAEILDAIALLALVAGVAASLGAGMMTLADGLAAGFGAPDGPIARLIVSLLIVLTFVASSVTGLQRGIRILSDVNVRFFFLLAAFVFIAGPSLHIVKSAAGAVGEYASTFLPRSLAAPGAEDEQWRRDWTMYYFANWAAWAPITALFLGRIAVGYTVREFLLFTMVFPASFGVVWMSIFGGAVIGIDQTSGGAMTAALEARGPEGVIYAVLGELPLAAIMGAIFLFTTFISFVTAMDSNTHSIASVCSPASRQSDEAPGEGLWIKIFWGVLIGAVAWLMTATNGIDGVRMLSNLGGAPGMLIIFGSVVALVRLMARPASSINQHPNARAASEAPR